MSYSLEVIQNQTEKILYPEKFADYKNLPPKLIYNQCNAGGLVNVAYFLAS